MKVAIIFDLPEEKEDLRLALEGWKYQAVVHDMDEWLRRRIKYSKRDEKGLQSVRDKLTGLCNDREVE